MGASFRGSPESGGFLNPSALERVTFSVGPQSAGGILSKESPPLSNATDLLVCHIFGISSSSPAIRSGNAKVHRVDKQKSSSVMSWQQRDPKGALGKPWIKKRVSCPSVLPSVWWEFQDTNWVQPILPVSTEQEGGSRDSR